MRSGNRVLLLILALVVPTSAWAQDDDERFQPTTLDWILWGAGVGSAGLAQLLDTDTREVPAAGLDLGDIALGWDRRSIGDPETGSITPSDALALVSLAYPPVVSALTAEEGTFWNSQVRSAWIEGEAVVLSVGVSLVLKKVTGRARPFTYLGETDRPDDPAYDVTEDRAFESFPSGHATIAWSGAMTGMTLLVLDRPDLPFLAHFAGGFAAGALATSTSVLRVESETHFPTDALSGAALGAAAGITIPLLHDRGASVSRGPAWRAALLGLVAGTGAALLIAPRL